MAYVLNGANNEADGFTKTIAGFALRAMHESVGLVNTTNVVTPTQGNEFLVPNFAPITYQDYNPAGTGGTWGTGDAVVQNPALDQQSITASPAVASTSFDIFYGWTTSFQLAATLGAEMGESFLEKVDQRVTNAFKSFKVSPNNTNYAASADGFTRVLELGAMELLPTGTTAGVGAFQATSVLELIRKIKQNHKAARMPGVPTIVLDSNGDDGVVGSSMQRLLAELTGAAVTGSLSMLGEELLSSGQIENIYGCRVIFTTFLQAGKRTVDAVADTPVLVGAYYGDSALFTVLKEGLQIKTGETPGGLQMWMTGLGYFGAGVGDKRRGGAINIVQTA